jgi:DNA-directed RNA polymerase specialized sigma24 family protein
VTWPPPYPSSLLEGTADTAPGAETRYESWDTIEPAFTAGLQRLPPRQAAVLLPGGVLGFSAGEVATMLDGTRTSAKGIFPGRIGARCCP